MYEFIPVMPHEIREQLRHLPFDWWICGGWAIDLYAGYPVRIHQDMDVAILRRDHTLLKSSLQDWEFKIADKGELHEWNNPEIPHEIHAIWSRKMGADKWLCEFLINESSDTDWIFRKDKTIHFPLKQIGMQTANGISFLRPEIPLLYKSAYCLEKDNIDFHATVRLMKDIEKLKLKEWITKLNPSCPWLKDL